MYVVDKYDAYSTLFWNTECIYALFSYWSFLGLSAEVRPSLSNQRI